MAPQQELTESPGGNGLVKITQMQMENCGYDRCSKQRRTGLREAGKGPWENDAWAKSRRMSRC